MENKKSLLQLWNRIKNTKTLPYIVIGAAAFFVLLLFPESDVGSEAEPSGTAVTSAEYCALLESKAEELICYLAEVKDCSVFITLSEGYTYIYATDQKVNETDSPDSTGYSKSTEKTIVLAEADGDSRPILINEKMPEVAGVAVVCRGASYETQYKIIELMCALFDVSSNKISVQT